MEQAGTRFVITVNRRLNKLETDVTVIKREQCAHMEQIEALALKLNEVDDKVNRIEQRLNKVEDQLQGHTNRFNKLDQDIAKLKEYMVLVLQALAIKY